ncbi:MAG: preprotein translocase subunit SecG [Oscillospiraceae bacterium]|nr:preprotein translocase subunit SecG [Oscillospiraceae bacterium]
MDIVKYALIGLEVLASLALILVVLFQSGKEAGLSGALTGGSDTYLSKSKKKNMDKMLASATKWVALVWVLLTLSLSFI